MSYSHDVKTELARLAPGQPCCQKAELVALMRMCGTISLGNEGSFGLNIVTEHAAVARRIFTLLKNLFGVTTEILVRKRRRLRKNNIYVLRIPPSREVADMLASMGILNGRGGINTGSDRGLLRRVCCRRAYLRGAFLGGGSVSKPEGDYHLELVADNGDFARVLQDLLGELNLPAGLTERKQHQLVYLKGAEAITGFLTVIGAHGALLDFENVRVVKDVRNQVNRLVNCETANLEKTVNTGIRQIEKIKRLIREIGLERLPPSLAEVAKLRLEHPDANLQELSCLHGKMTKSGINHRLRKLERLADEIHRNGSKIP